MFMSLQSRYLGFDSSFTTEVNIRRALRVNTLKISCEELIPRLEKKGVILKKIPFLKNSFWYESEFSLGATAEYLQGFYYLQETASQLPPLALLSDIKTNDLSDVNILDMAAAPGSKTTQLAQITNNKVPIIALDSDAHRLSSLRNNIERMGVKNVAIYKKDARFSTDLKITFSHVLLDAPCSGNFCIEPKFFIIKDLVGIKQNAKRQKELLKSAYRVLKKNGVLVYSTCSLEPEENELVIDWFLKKYSDMFLVDTSLSIGDSGFTDVFDKKLDKSLNLTKRLWPHKTGTQGFFIAKMVKK